MKKLSVIIPVGNEIHNIKDVIESIDFADEILVVDSFSDDGTFEQANKLPVKVIRRKYDYAASQKNWAIPQAKYDWILIIDADERVSTELKSEIIQILKLPENKIAAYWIGRENYFMGKKVNYSGWQNDGVYRLFKKKLCKYENKYVHERLIIKGKVKSLG